MTNAPPRLRLITGKGGVGKTAVAAAVALSEARAGRRTLLCEINGRDRLAGLLGVEPVGYALREVFDNVSLIDINPRDAIHEYALLTLRFEALYKAVFENGLVRRFLRLVPSLSELVMLGKIWFHAQEQAHGRPRYDVIVVDAPATGHALALLGAPRAVQNTVPPGPMRENARLIEAMLTDPQHTALNVVTTPEDMPVTEAQELLQGAAALGVRAGTVFINSRLGPLPAEGLAALRPLADDPELAGVHRALVMREAKRLAGEEHLQRLPGPLLAAAQSLPRLATGPFDRSAVESLATLLRPWQAQGVA